MNKFIKYFILLSFSGGFYANSYAMDLPVSDLPVSDLPVSDLPVSDKIVDKNISVDHENFFFIKVDGLKFEYVRLEQLKKAYNDEKANELKLEKHIKRARQKGQADIAEGLEYKVYSIKMGLKQIQNNINTTEDR